jgi:hypothetical protein
MNKTEAIQYINDTEGTRVLNESNTLWSNCTRDAQGEGWWLNIPLTSFRKGTHIILNRDSTRFMIHLCLKPGEILSPAMKFRCKDQMAIIYISAANPKRLADSFSGGSKHSFMRHIVSDYRY